MSTEPEYDLAGSTPVATTTSNGATVTRTTTTSSSDSSGYGSFGLPEGMSEDDIVSVQETRTSVVLDPRGLSYRLMTITAVLLLVVLMLALFVDLQRSPGLPLEGLRGGILDLVSPALPFLFALPALLAPVVIAAAAFCAGRLMAVPKVFALVLMLGAFVAFGLPEFLLHLVDAFVYSGTALDGSIDVIYGVVQTGTHGLALVLLLLGLIGVHLTTPSKGWQKLSS